VERRHTIEVREGITVTALQCVPAEAASDAVVVYAPGAGANLRDGFGVYLAGFLEQAGYESWRFQFPYAERGRSAPDPPALLEATWVAVLEAVRRTAGPASPKLIAGGRSMGGRIASMAVANGTAVAGLALFAYPLLPPGRQSTDRTQHFLMIGVPTMFCSGTRDSFGTPEQLREAVGLVPDAALHFLEGADHGFAMLKASERTREDIWREACEALVRFAGRLGAP
jgi:predicted alpha/beta-hydrolase family hydrolase